MIRCRKCVRVCPSPCCCCLFMCELCHIRTSFLVSFYCVCRSKTCIRHLWSWEISTWSDLWTQPTTNQRVTGVQSRRRNLCAISCCYRRRRSDCVTVKMMPTDPSIGRKSVCCHWPNSNWKWIPITCHCMIIANYVNSKCITLVVVEVTITAITCQTNVQTIQSILSFNCRPSFTDFNLNFSVCSVIVASIDCHFSPKLELKNWVCVFACYFVVLFSSRLIVSIQDDVHSVHRVVCVRR